ncbi:MAG: prepilin-type N-terminal cleavage/methylation domain-containing protein [Gammaproteobacteria bacterium]|nr:prepilin-type N-terminal cleavage/methylation domain-containing protein [Gammaproteobacteria bacterium]
MLKFRQGFTLIELMVVVGILGILAAIAIPSYKTYIMKAKFSEVVLATTPVKTAVEIALQMGSVKDVAQLKGGSFGIPINIGISDKSKPYRYLESLVTENGKITASGTAEVGAATLIWEIQSDLTPPVLWEMSGTCVNLGLC